MTSKANYGQGDLLGARVGDQEGEAMTEPTKWTPERALADRIAHAIDAIHHTAVRNPRDGGASMRRAKDVLIGIVSEVVAEREAAVAEITKQKARADRAERALVGAGWQDLGGAEWKPPLGKPPRFFEVMPKEASDELDYLRSEVERLRAELAAKQAAPEQGQAGPSDEEIRDAIESVHMCGDNVTADALRKVAQRAGVRL